MKPLISVAVCLLLAPLLFAQTLRMLPPSELGWRRIDLGAMTNKLITLRASTNLTDWRDIAVAHDGLFGYADPMSGVFQYRFYRTTATDRTGQDDFKNQVFLRLDPFLLELSSGESPENMKEIRWMKFAIPTDEPGRVYYQDSTRYPYHFQFAAARLPMFQGMSRAEFDLKTLRLAGQKAILGAILFPPEGQVRECGIQFVGLDPFPPERIVEWFQWVKSSLAFDPPCSFFYLPSMEQSRFAQAYANYFASNGVQVASADRWRGGNNVYSAGWAIGRLVFVAASEINAAYVDGRLTAWDILMTDTVPAKIPSVAGIIALSPSTPNSHVAILSRSFGTPFAYLPAAEERERVRALAGKEVVFRAWSVSQSDDVRVFALSVDIDPALKSGILAMKKATRLVITPKARYGVYSTNADGLFPSDIRYFGGKASNYGLLRRTIPANSQPAVAFSFDLWDDFMHQTMAGGKSLKDEIKSRLDKYVYPPNIPSLTNDLAYVRALVEKSADFSPAQRQAVTNALSQFDPTRKIRIRSSTNVEDSEAFTGAGLYDSYSGCLADDMAPDNSNPTGTKKQGVFRAMRKVYASFYNDNAFMERLRLGVEEDKAGMALLAHYSFPDVDEMANGVATINYTPNSQEIELVTQLGAASVSNPDGNSQPEVVRASYDSSSGPILSLVSPSSLVPLGGKVMDWESDYMNLCRLIQSVSDGYRTIYPAKSSYMLDLEYKKTRPGDLIIKQVRTLPSPALSNTTPVLLSAPVTFAVFQGQGSDAMERHRLKARLTLSGNNVRMDNAAFSQCIWDEIQYEYVENGQIKTLTGALPSFPKPAHQYETNVSFTSMIDQWEIGTGDEKRTMSLRSTIWNYVLRNASQPLLTAGDFQLSLDAFYSTPKPGPFGGNISGGLRNTNPGSTVTNESVSLVPWLVSTPTYIPQLRSIACPGGIHIETSFYWPQLRSDSITAGYTAPLVRWVETRITGIGGEPIILKGYYSQTYSPCHHNFAETFIFEPRLEPGITPSILEALRQADIQLLAVSVGIGSTTADVAWIQGLDGAFRLLK